MEQVQKYRVDVVELKKIMVEQNLDKIVDLSAASTVDRNTLSKVISGDVKPSTTVIEKLMSALHIPPEKAGTIFFSINLNVEVVAETHLCGNAFLILILLGMKIAAWLKFMAM